MISLESFLTRASSELGVEVSAKLNSQTNVILEIRFASLDVARSFSIQVHRSWKTTQCFLKVDLFAGQVMQFLFLQTIENLGRLRTLFSDNEALFSEITFLLNGESILEPKSGIDYGSKAESVTFEANLLTSESSISHGLFSEREADFLLLVLRAITILLPISPQSYVSPEEVVGFPEGAVTEVLVNRYERDPRNRSAAITIHGKRCMACDFDFEESYGEVGSEYIVVHHVVPVSKMGADYKVDPKSDLVTVCANCHAMIHRRNPPYSIAEIRNLRK